ncbi:MAG: nuclear transport factor 2 family protein [Leptolyngbyaceae cyanobacterium]
MTDIQEVQSTNQSFYRAFEKKDLDAMAAIWSHGTGTLCIHPGRSALKGWVDVRESWQQIFANTQYLEVDVEMVATEVQGAIAYVVVVEKVMQVLQGRRFEARSMATNIFEKMGDRWYLTHHHGSPIGS